MILNSIILILFIYLSFALLYVIIIFILQTLEIQRRKNYLIKALKYSNILLRLFYSKTFAIKSHPYKVKILYN